MEPTAAEIAAHYMAMEDAPLLSLAEERDDLKDEARKLLLQELERRALDVPAILPQPEKPEYTAHTWVTVERFRDLSSGIVARGALEAAAIPCFLRDENTVRLDWQISNFIGGLRLQVAAEDEVEAREILAGPALDHDPVSDAGMPTADERCPICGSPEVHRTQRYHWLSLLSVWLFGIPAAVRSGKPEERCERCGARWTCR